MTITTDINAITLTPNAIAIGQAAAVNLPSLLTQLLVHVGEKQRLIKEIQKVHPSTGPDAANYAALNAILAKL